MLCIRCLSCGKIQVVCPACKGTTGRYEPNRYIPCSTCEGTGFIYIDCPICEGEGELNPLEDSILSLVRTGLLATK